MIILLIKNCRKSRIAIEYCYQYRRDNPDAHVFWVHGSNRARFEAAYQDLARTMRIPGFDDPKTNTLRLVSDWLSNEDNGSWLMVLDNADDTKVWIGPVVQEPQQGSPQGPAPLADYIPRGSHGFVVITTRDSQLGKRLANVKEKPIDVLPFGSTESEILLRSKLSEDDRISQEDANEIIKALDFLPLAITQAAAYLDQNDMTIARYLQLFRAGKADTSDLLKKDVYDPGRDYEIQNSVFQTWKISFHQISKQYPRAAEVLSLMAVLDRQAIPENLLRRPGEPELEFAEAIQKLKAFSLITRETEASIFGMHRLVQLATRMWLEYEKKLSTWQEAALSVVSECCPPTGEYENWASLEALSPHLQVVLDYQFGIELCQLQRSKILNTLGWYNREHRRYSIAYQYHSESLALRESNLDPEHPDTLASMKDLASVLYHQGRHSEAEEMDRQVLEVAEKVLGPEHPTTIASMNNLAVVLRSQGRYGEAEEMQRRALGVVEKVLGPEHPTTLASMNNLAEVLRSQGRHGEAEGMQRRALEVAEKALGPEHPDTLASMNNLAAVLWSQGRYGEAEEMQRRTSEVAAKVLGPEHPTTLASINSLAEVLRIQGRHGEAEEMQRQTLEVAEKVLGPEHLTTLASMYNLAVVLLSQGKYGEAEEMQRRALEVAEKALGPEHPDTLASMNSLAAALLIQGRYGEAEEMQRRAFEVVEKALGPEHPDTLASMNNLAEVLWCQGRYGEGEEMHQRALQTREKVLGLDHPDTLSSVYGLACLHRIRKQYGAASVLYQRACSGYQKRLGSDHPSTLECCKDYFSMLEEMK